MRTFVTAGLYSPGDLVGGLEAGRDELKTQFMTRQVLKFIACLRGYAANPDHMVFRAYMSKIQILFKPRPDSAQSRFCVIDEFQSHHMSRLFDLPYFDLVRNGVDLQPRLQPSLLNFLHFSSVRHRYSI
jgi:hypothetical protein